LDAGLKLFFWKPKKAGHEEQYFANIFLTKVKDERKGANVVEVGETGNDEFWKILGGKPETISSEKESKSEIKDTDNLKILKYDVNSNKFSELEKGTIHEDTLDSGSVHIVDCIRSFFVWVGKDVDKDIASTGILVGNEFLKTIKKNVPFQKVTDEKEPKTFFDIFQN